MRNRHWRRSVRCDNHDFTGLEGVDFLQREKMMSKKKALIGAALAGVMGAVGAAEIEFVVGGKVYPGTLNDSGAAQALFERLPLEVTFEDFGSNERIAYVKPELSLSGKADHGAPKPGTFAVYEPWGNLCVFRVPFRASNDLFILGEVAPETLEAIVKSGSETVTIQVSGR